MTPDEAKSQSWDVIIIGAGMGGGLAGRRLAERGLSVLFLEQGREGYRTEQQPYSPSLADPMARQLRGYWPKPVEAHDGDSVSRYFAPLGCGVGGSSVFYAAALERPEPHDLDDIPGKDHPTGGWPVGFDAFLPYFHQAEDILYVRGEADSLSKVPSPQLRTIPTSPRSESRIAPTAWVANVRGPVRWTVALQVLNQHLPAEGLRFWQSARSKNSLRNQLEGFPE